MSSSSSLFTTINSSVSAPGETKDLSEDFLNESRRILNMAASPDSTLLVTVSDTGTPQWSRISGRLHIIDFTYSYEINIWKVAVTPEGQIKFLAKKKCANLKHDNQGSVGWQLHINSENEIIVAANNSTNGCGYIYKIKRNTGEHGDEYTAEKFSTHQHPWKIKRIAFDGMKLILVNVTAFNSRIYASYTKNVEGMESIKEIDVTAPADSGLETIDSIINLTGNKIIALCAHHEEEKSFIVIRTYSIANNTWTSADKMAEIPIKDAKEAAQFAKNSRIFYWTKDFVVVAIQLDNLSMLSSDRIFSIWDLTGARPREIAQLNNPIFGTFDYQGQFLSLTNYPNAFVVKSKAPHALWLVELNSNTGMRATKFRDSKIEMAPDLPNSCFVGNVLLVKKPSRNPVEFVTELHLEAERVKTYRQYIRAALLPFIYQDLFPIILSYLYEPGRPFEFVGKETICTEALPAAGAGSRQQKRKREEGEDHDQELKRPRVHR